MIPTALDDVADRLRAQLGVSRVTVRLGPKQDLPLVAESLAPNAASLRKVRNVPQMTAETVQWVVRHRRVLAVGNAIEETPRTPRAMTNDFGVRAFLIAPIESDGEFLGTVSAHAAEIRTWAAHDIEAAADAARACAGPARVYVNSIDTPAR
jgi:maleate isomerase